MNPFDTLATIIESANVAVASSTLTIPDVTTATTNWVTLTGNVTMTFPTSAVGKSFALFLVQDVTGSRTVTWPSTVKWSAGVAPTLTKTASKTDAIMFVANPNGSWLGFVAGLNY